MNETVETTKLTDEESIVVDPNVVVVVDEDFDVGFTVESVIVDDVVVVVGHVRIVVEIVVVVVVVCC